MALIHRLSDAIALRIDRDAQGHPVIELEFRFIRYRLIIDDKKKGEKLRSLLDIILKPTEVAAGRPMMPKFYKEQSTNDAP